MRRQVHRRLCAKRPLLFYAYTVGVLLYCVVLLAYSAGVILWTKEQGDHYGERTNKTSEEVMNSWAVAVRGIGDSLFMICGAVNIGIDFIVQRRVWSKAAGFVGGLVLVICEIVGVILWRFQPELPEDPSPEEIWIRSPSSILMAVSAPFGLVAGVLLTFRFSGAREVDHIATIRSLLENIHITHPLFGDEVSLYSMHIEEVTDYPNLDRNAGHDEESAVGGGAGQSYSVVYEAAMHNGHSYARHGAAIPGEGAGVQKESGEEGGGERRQTGIGYLETPTDKEEKEGDGDTIPEASTSGQEQRMMGGRRNDSGKKKILETDIDGIPEVRTDELGERDGWGRQAVSDFPTNTRRKEKRKADHGDSAPKESKQSEGDGDCGKVAATSRSGSNFFANSKTIPVLSVSEFFAEARREGKLLETDLDNIPVVRIVAQEESDGEARQTNGAVFAHASCIEKYGEKDGKSGPGMGTSRREKESESTNVVPSRQRQVNPLCHTTPSAQLRGGRCEAGRVNDRREDGNGKEREKTSSNKAATSKQREEISGQGIEPSRQGEETTRQGREPGRLGAEDYARLFYQLYAGPDEEGASVQSEDDDSVEEEISRLVQELSCRKHETVRQGEGPPGGEETGNTGQATSSTEAGISRPREINYAYLYRQLYAGYQKALPGTQGEANTGSEVESNRQGEVTVSAEEATGNTEEESGNAGEASPNAEVPARLQREVNYDERQVEEEEEEVSSSDERILRLGEALCTTEPGLRRQSEDTFSTKSRVSSESRSWETIFSWETVSSIPTDDAQSSAGASSRGLGNMNTRNDDSQRNDGDDGDEEDDDDDNAGGGGQQERTAEAADRENRELQTKRSSLELLISQQMDLEEHVLGESLVRSDPSARHFRHVDSREPSIRHQNQPDSCVINIEDES